MSALSTLLLVLSAGGSARQPLPARSPTTTHADSLAAIEQVFRYRRRWSRIGTLGFGLSVSAQTVVLATGTFTPPAGTSFC